MATRLERIKIAELSGVDEPANKVPGWLIMKSAKLSKLNDPVRLTDGRVVGRVLGFEGSKVTVDWASDEIRDLAKTARVERRADGIYLVGTDTPLGIANAVLSGQPVLLT